MSASGAINPTILEFRYRALLLRLARCQGPTTTRLLDGAGKLRPRTERSSCLLNALAARSTTSALPSPPSSSPLLPSKWRAMSAQAQYNLHEAHPTRSAQDALEDAQEAGAPLAHAVIPMTPERGHEARTYVVPRRRLWPPRGTAREYRCHVAHAPAHQQNQERRAAPICSTRTHRRVVRTTSRGGTKTRTQIRSVPASPAAASHPLHHTHPTPDTPAHRASLPSAPPPAAAKEEIMEFKEIYQQFASDEAAPPSANKGEAEDRSARAEPARVQRAEMRKRQPCSEVDDARQLSPACRKAGAGGEAEHANANAGSFVTCDPGVRSAPASRSHHPHLIGRTRPGSPAPRAGYPSHSPRHARAQDPIAPQEHQACGAPERSRTQQQLDRECTCGPPRVQQNAPGTGIPPTTPSARLRKDWRAVQRTAKEDHEAPGDTDGCARDAERTWCMADEAHGPAAHIPSLGVSSSLRRSMHGRPAQFIHHPLTPARSKRAAESK
ncbi:hypothetical protein C8F04DRAFT_1394850 [Mycena alexandri]|uniref:Uncharacterized protein n=1 Tax=Mycena alexandri TaxID=1745969 RepID=A0AAD6SWC5_9AGAR|nr:hypothetical protein C8F04DRAFT_1394850 [Mycena alexandri]